MANVRRYILPAAENILGGRVQVGFFAIADAACYVGEGKIRALAAAAIVEKLNAGTNGPSPIQNVTTVVEHAKHREYKSL